jgi:hypothetical protein
VQPITIEARMVVPSAIRETVADFGAFVGLVLGFRRDPECVRIAWLVLPGQRAAERPYALARSKQREEGDRCSGRWSTTRARRG